MESKQDMNHNRNEAFLKAIPKAIKGTVHELLIYLYAASQAFFSQGQNLRSKAH